MTGSAQLAGATAIVAIVLGPAALWLARTQQVHPIPGSWATSAASAAAAGILAALVAGAGEASTDVAVVVVAAPMLAFGFPAALVDVREQRLPDALTAPLLVTTLIALAVVAGVTGSWSAGLRALLVAVLVTGAALAVKGVRTAAIGWGDIKLLPSVGVVVGWSGWTSTVEAATLWAVLIPATALVTASLTAAPPALIARGRRERGVAGSVAGWSSAVPYGPALLAGAAAALVPGP
jgi:leader peptidase (prepilin peptidase) / N-methyltransferase